MFNICNASFIKKRVSIISLFIFSLFLLNPIKVHAADGDTIWAKSIVSGTDNAVFNGVTTDSDGNVYAVGEIDNGDPYVFGNDVTVTSAFNGASAIVVKYNSSGVAQWAKSIESGSDESVFNNVATDSEGNMYVVGGMGSGTYGFGNDVTVTGGEALQYALIVKYNSSGVAQWAKTVTSVTEGSLYKDIVIHDDNIYVAGKLNSIDVYNFGNDITVSTTNSSANALIVKYNSSGVAQWAKTTVGGDSSSVFHSISINEDDGSLYAAGSSYTLSTAVDFGNDVTVMGGYDGNNVLVVKYNSSGVAQWAKSTSESAPYYSLVSGVSVDGDGNVYVVGYIGGTDSFDFGDGVTVAGGYDYNNALLIKYNSSGVAQWARSVGEGATDESDFTGVYVDLVDNVYVVGGIISTDSYDFGNGVSVSGVYGGDIVLVKYNSLGNAQLAKTVTTGPDESDFYNITIDKYGYIYGVGELYSTSTFDFGNDVTLSPGYAFWNPFIVKYESGNVLEETHISSPSPTPTSVSNSTITVPQAPSCNDPSIHSVPNLFQVNSKSDGTSATIYFSPLSETNEYFVSFSTNPNAEEHGASVTLLKEGVQSYTVNYLKPNNTYYFKVRGQNGCSTGGWSNIMKTRTNGEVYYKNSIINILKSLSSVKTNTIPSYSSQPTPKPLPTVKPSPSAGVQTVPVQKPVKKHCFLWWCW